MSKPITIITTRISIEEQKKVKAIPEVKAHRQAWARLKWFERNVRITKTIDYEKWDALVEEVNKTGGLIQSSFFVLGDRFAKPRNCALVR